MNINDAQKQIADIKQAIEGLRLQRTEGQRDKTGMYFAVAKIDRDSAYITFEAYHGYYGNSSVSSDMSPKLANYVVRALRELKWAIIQEAIWLAEQDAQLIAKEVEAEAKHLLAWAQKEGGAQ